MWAKALLIMTLVYLIAAGLWVLSSGFVENQLLNVACDPTRELWRDVNAAFITRFEEKTGNRLFIRQSHGGSGSQARAVIDGLPADVVTLALFSDTDAIRKAGLLDVGWEGRFPNRSLPYVSTIVFVVRKGNPKGIRDWSDLVRDDVRAITPNPKISGNGKWSFLALWGSVIWHGGNEEEAFNYVASVYRRVPVLDAAARGATMTFAQKGLGDVHLTWENEAYLEVQEAKGDLEIIYPSVSVLAEPHIAIVDANVKRKGSEAVAKAYLEFLYIPEAQELIAKNYYRPINSDVLSRYRDRFPNLRMEPAPSLVATGKWDEVQSRFFAEGGVFDRIYRDAKP